MSWQRELAASRLVSQGIAGSPWRSPVEAVAGMGALQAQDYAASLWAMGLRANATREAVLAAIDAGEIVRTRPTRQSAWTS